MIETVAYQLFTTYNEGVPLCAFHKDTTRFCLHTILHAERQVGNCKCQFSKVFVMTRPGIELQVYRFGGERSTNRPTTVRLELIVYYDNGSMTLCRTNTK